MNGTYIISGGEKVTEIGFEKWQTVQINLWTQTQLAACEGSLLYPNRKNIYISAM